MHDNLFLLQRLAQRQEVLAFELVLAVNQIHRQVFVAVRTREFVMGWRSRCFRRRCRLLAGRLVRPKNQCRAKH